MIKVLEKKKKIQSKNKKIQTTKKKIQSKAHNSIIIFDHTFLEI